MAQDKSPADLGARAADRIETIYHDHGAEAAAEALRQDYLTSSATPAGRAALSSEIADLRKDDPQGYKAINFEKGILDWAEAEIVRTDQSIATGLIYNLQ
jgi:hypothetical protein